MGDTQSNTQSDRPHCTCPEAPAQKPTGQLNASPSDVSIKVPGTGKCTYITPKFNGLVDYHTIPEGISIPLKSGGRLSFGYSLINGLYAGNSTVTSPWDAVIPSASANQMWLPAGTSGAFDFLPFVTNASFQNTQFIIREAQNVRTYSWTATPGSKYVGNTNLWYYAPLNPLPYRLVKRYNTVTAAESWREDNFESRTYYIYNYNSYHTNWPAGTPVMRGDSMGNTIQYNYSSSIALHSITGSEIGSVVPYFSYSSLSVNNGINPIYKIFLYDTSNPSNSRTLYYAYYQDVISGNILPSGIIYPDGSTKAVFAQDPRASPATFGYGHYGIQKEVDAYLNTTYFVFNPYYSYLNGSFHKTVEPGNKITYFQYDTSNAKTAIVQQGRPPSYYAYATLNNGVMQRTYSIDALQNNTYFGWDQQTWGGVSSLFGGVDRLTKQRNAIGALTYYNYNYVGSMVNSLNLTTGAHIQYTYAPNLRDMSTMVGPRNVTGVFNQITTYTYDSNRNLISQVNPLYYGVNTNRDSAGRIYKRVNENSASTYFNFSSTTGFLKSQVDATNNVIYYSYDSFGNTTKSVSARWKNTGSESMFATYFRYSPLDQVTKSFSPIGASRYFSYNLNHQLFTTVDPLGTTTSRRYNNRSLLSAIGQNNGATLLRSGAYFLYDYDTYNNKVGETNWLSHRTYYVYDAVDRLILLRDALSNLSYFGYDALGNQTVFRNARQSTFYQVYDGASRRVTSTDWSGTAYYGYDLDSNVVKYRDTNQHTTQMAYDAVNRLVLTVDPANGTSYFGYDGVGNVTIRRRPLGNGTTWSYDLLNRVHRAVDTSFDSSYYQYDADGDILSVTDPRSNTTSFSYDLIDRRRAIIDPLGNITYFGYDLADNMRRIEDARRNTSYFNYDLLSRMVKRIDASGNRYYNYDNNDNMILFQNQLGNNWTRSYDALNRPIIMSDPLTDSVYFGYDQVGNIVKISDPLTNRTTTTFDPINRPINVSDPTNGQTYFGYDAVGNLLTYRDPNANITRYAYDTLNRLAKVSDPLSETTYFSYDANSNLIQVTDPLSHSTAYRYDSEDRLVSWTDPLTNNISSIYDASSNNQNGFYNTITYDQLNRKHAVLIGYGLQAYGLMPYGNPVAPSLNQQYFNYDQVGNLSSMIDNWGSSSFAYDGINRLHRRTTPNNDSVYFGYDGASNLNVVAYPEGTSISTRTFDAANRMTQVISPSSHLGYYSYNAASLVKKQIFGNRVVSYYSYDTAQRITNIQHIKTGGSIIAGLGYRRDLGGRINRILRENALAIYYQYDAVNRLTSEVWTRTAMNQQVYAFTYTYDQAGNRKTQNRTYVPTATLFEATYYAYNAGNELYKRRVLPTLTTSYYLYDIDGSLLQVVDQSNNTTYFRYDQNRMIASIAPPSPSLPWNFVNDGLLNRVQIQKGGVQSYFLWNNMNQLEERTTGSALIARSTHGKSLVPGVGSIVEIQRPIGSLTYFQYLHMDHQGSVVAITDANQNVINTMTNDAFGRNIVAPTAVHPWLENDFQFQSNWMTFYIGGYQYCLSPSRVYDPLLGRFLQRDPLPNLVNIIRSTRGNGYGIYARTILARMIRRSLKKNLNSKNLFVFAAGNPVNRTDSSGFGDDDNSWSLFDPSSWFPSYQIDPNNGIPGQSTPHPNATAPESYKDCIKKVNRQYYSDLQLARARLNIDIGTVEDLNGYNSAVDNFSDKSKEAIFVALAAAATGGFSIVSEGLAAGEEAELASSLADDQLDAAYSASEGTGLGAPGSLGLSTNELATGAARAAIPALLGTSVGLGLSELQGNSTTNILLQGLQGGLGSGLSDAAGYFTDRLDNLANYELGKAIEDLPASVDPDDIIGSLLMFASNMRKARKRAVNSIRKCKKCPCK